MAAVIKSHKTSPHSLLSRLTSLLQTSQWSDCTFMVGEGESKEEFRAHRILLAACSPVFEAMCFGPLAERGAISIPDLEPKAFRALLQYVYTDNVQFTCVDEACDVMYAAKKYMIQNLSQLCYTYINRNMQVKDVVAVYEYAKLLEEEALYEPCLLMLKKYALEVLNDKTHHLSSASVAELLASDAINGCECCLIEGALSWAEQECEHRGLQSSTPNKRAILVDCGAWFHLRFLTLSQQQLTRVRQIDGLLTPEEVCFIKGHIQWSKGSDEKRSLQCVNMCNGTMCSGLGLFDDLESNEENTNIVVVRDKWKRRRLNLVLIGAESPESPAERWRDNRTPMDHHEESMLYSGTFPSSICNALIPRKEVGYRLSFCRRNLLKQSVTVSGPVDLQVAVRVGSPIDLRAVQIYSRLIPSTSIFVHKSNSYTEMLEVEVRDESGKLLSQSRFSDKVEYNTEIMIHLKKFVRLTQDQTYSIVVKLLDNLAEYPLSFLGQFARSQEINFTFMDRVALTGTGVVNRLDMGFIRGFAYS